MKTTIYIDGYNLYYGVLRNTPYKWLDVVKLFTRIAHQQIPNAEIIKVKFFTAPVKIKLSNHGEASQKSQRDYHRALAKLYPHFELIEGFFTVSEGWYPAYKKPIDRNDTIRAWRLEEKQTDVNIALDMYRDSAKGKTEQIILVSNDSDLIPAIRAIKEDFSNITTGVVMPILKKDGTTQRQANRGLSELSNWTWSNIQEEELKTALLPEMIPTKKKPILKPPYW